MLLELPFKSIKNFWDKYIVCPKLAIIAFTDAENWFKSIIEDLFKLLTPVIRPAAAYFGAGISYFKSDFRNIIMEAGLSKHILKIIYDGISRLVEPYALAYKRRKDGIAREYFYAWDRSGGRSGHKGIKSFIADKIQSIQITEESFSPRFPIELIKGGSFFSSSTFTKSNTKKTPLRSYNSDFAFKNTVTIECVYCGKRFKRNNYDTNLKEHKDNYGNKCFGRFGRIVY